MSNLSRVRFGASILAIIALIASGGCSLRSMAVNAIVPTLANPDSYLSEEDPELVREALPFLLKTIESILESEPKQAQALVFACSGFTLYGSAFLYVDAQIADSQGDYARAADLSGRTWRIFVRARNYCLRSLELKYAGINNALRQDPTSALKKTTAADVEVLYLLSAAWGLAISNALDQPELVADLPAVRALLVRALELDEDYDEGALHAALITLEALPPELGGSPERARAHFDRAVELSHGLDAGPYVTFAGGVSVPEEHRAEFQELLAKALAVDPNEDKSRRLLNLVSQRQARFLLAQIDDLFFDPLVAEEALP